MNESTNNNTKERKTKNIVPVETGPIEIEGIEGFSPEEMARILKVKVAIANGRYSDITNEHRKLLFVQWLIEHGKLTS